MINLLRVTLLLEIFLIPLLGPGHLGFEQTKVIFFYIFTSLAGLIWLFLLYQQKLRFQFDKISLIAGLFIVWLFITSLLGVDPVVSLLGAQPYLQGWLTYFMLYIFFLVLKDSKLPLFYLAVALISSATIVSLTAIKEWTLLNLFNVPIATYNSRVVSTFGQPNLYSGFLLLTITFWFLVIDRAKSKIWPSLGLAITVLAIFLSESRTSIILLTLIHLVYLIKRSKLSPSKITFLIIILTLLLTIPIRNLITQEIITPHNNQWLKNNSPEKRIYIWPIFVQLIIQKPLFGYGLETIPTAFTGYFKTINWNILNNPSFHGLKNLNIDRTHNYLLDLTISSGFFTLFIWLVLFLFIFKRTKSTVIKASLIIYLIWIQFQPQGIVQLLFFWQLAARQAQEQGSINNNFYPD